MSKYISIHYGQSLKYCQNPTQGISESMEIISIYGLERNLCLLLYLALYVQVQEISPSKDTPSDSEIGPYIHMYTLHGSTVF